MSLRNATWWVMFYTPEQVEATWDEHEIICKRVNAMDAYEALHEALSSGRYVWADVGGVRALVVSNSDPSVAHWFTFSVTKKVTTEYPVTITKDDSTL